jgi:hypothetical protein
MEISREKADEIADLLAGKIERETEFAAFKHGLQLEPFRVAFCEALWRCAFHARELDLEYEQHLPDALARDLHLDLDPDSSIKSAFSTRIQ